MSFMLKIALQKFTINHWYIKFKKNIIYKKPILQQLRNVYLITLCLQNNKKHNNNKCKRIKNQYKNFLIIISCVMFDCLDVWIISYNVYFIVLFIIRLRQRLLFCECVCKSFNMKFIYVEYFSDFIIFGWKIESVIFNAAT